MYPTLYHAVHDLFGIGIGGLKFLNSFGFFVALAFAAAAWTLKLELQRKTAQGLLRNGTATITEGAPARPLDMVLNGIIGFILGWKFSYLLLNSDEALADPPAFLLSGTGYLFPGLLVGAGFAWWVWRDAQKRRLPEPRQRTITVAPAAHVANITMTAALWGFIGAKLFHWIETPRDLLNFIQHPSGDSIISGLTMYGGLIVAGFMVVRYFRKHGLTVLPSMDAAAPGLMLAYAIGRIGCQVSGDGDWGIVNSAYITNPDGTVATATLPQVQDRIAEEAMFYAHHFGSLDAVPMKSFPAPSFLPEWAVAYTYPHNVNSVGMDMAGCGDNFWGRYCATLPLPVFPTPLYEVLICGVFGLLLWAFRKRFTVPGTIFAVYMMLNGFERFWIEKIRVNEPFLGPITQAEVISTLLFVLGLAGYIWLKRRAHGPQAAH
ncbi:MAG: prolipoprotein diacylglyceryl transferase [Flavobacteriales bacterium]|nr:prolipoprotein diacylglyceryl transferase [Flavobacteriales bacterium]